MVLKILQLKMSGEEHLREHTKILEVYESAYFKYTKLYTSIPKKWLKVNLIVYENVYFNQ